jgi:hypothetical protein
VNFLAIKTPVHKGKVSRRGGHSARSTAFDLFGEAVKRWTNLDRLQHWRGCGIAVGFSFERRLMVVI